MSRADRGGRGRRAGLAGGGRADRRPHRSPPAWSGSAGCSRSPHRSARGAPVTRTQRRTSCRTCCSRSSPAARSRARVVPAVAAALARGGRARPTGWPPRCSRGSLLVLTPVALLLAAVAGPLDRPAPARPRRGRVRGCRHPDARRLRAAGAAVRHRDRPGRGAAGAPSVRRAGPGPAAVEPRGHRGLPRVRGAGRRPRTAPWRFVPSRGAELVLAGGTTLGVVALSLPLLVPVRRAGVRLRPTLRFPPGTAAAGPRASRPPGVAALLAQQAAVVVVLAVTNPERRRRRDQRVPATGRPCTCCRTRCSPCPWRRRPSPGWPGRPPTATPPPSRAPAPSPPGGLRRRVGARRGDAGGRRAGGPAPVHRPGRRRRPCARLAGGRRHRARAGPARLGAGRASAAARSTRSAGAGPPRRRPRRAGWWSWSLARRRGRAARRRPGPRPRGRGRARPRQQRGHVVAGVLLLLALRRAAGPEALAGVRQDLPADRCGRARGGGGRPAGRGRRPARPAQRRGAAAGGGRGGGCRRRARRGWARSSRPTEPAAVASVLRRGGRGALHGGRSPPVGGAARGAEPPRGACSCSRPAAGGTGRHVAELARGLSVSSARVTVAGPRATLAALDLPVKPTPPPSRCPSGRGRSPTRSPSGGCGRLARDADVVHAHGVRAGALAVLATRALRRRPAVVVTAHNAAVGGRRVRAAARSADVGGRARRGRRPGGVRRPRHRPARSAVPGRRPRPGAGAPTRPATRTREQVRAELGVPDGVALLVTVARLAPQKGLDVLAEAVRRLERRRRSRTDRWRRRRRAGDGPLEPALRDGPLRLLGVRARRPRPARRGRRRRRPEPVGGAASGGPGGAAGGRRRRRHRCGGYPRGDRRRAPGWCRRATPRPWPVRSRACSRDPPGPRRAPGGGGGAGARPADRAGRAGAGDGALRPAARGAPRAHGRCPAIGLIPLKSVVQTSPPRPSTSSSPGASPPPSARD